MEYVRDFFSYVIPYFTFVIVGLLFLRFKDHETRIEYLEHDLREREFARHLKDLKKQREEDAIANDNRKPS